MGGQTGHNRRSDDPTVGQLDSVADNRQIIRQSDSQEESRLAEIQIGRESFRQQSDSWSVGQIHTVSQLYSESMLQLCSGDPLAV